MNNPYYIDPRQPFPIRHFARDDSDPTGQYVYPYQVGDMSAPNYYMRSSGPYGGGVPMRGDDNMYIPNKRPAALTQSSGYYPFYRDMMANTLTDRALGPQDLPHVNDAALTTPVMDTDTVFEAARPYQDGDMSSPAPILASPSEQGFFAGPAYPQQTAPKDVSLASLEAMAPELMAPQIDQSTPAAPALAAESGPPSTQQSRGVLTGNARGSALPDMRIGRNEALMRIGGAIMGGASEGGLAAMQAGTEAYGAIQDANRQADADVFAIEEARRQSITDRMAASKGGSAASEGSPEAIGDVRSAIAKLQSAQDMFTQDTDSSLTGYNWKALASRLTGRTIGNEDEAKRLFLNEVRLDSVMKRVAETKGAISNAEMQLFASQAPTLDKNDIVWKDWLDRQLILQKKILRRLQTGEMIDPDAPLDADLESEKASAVVFDPATGKFSDEK